MRPHEETINMPANLNLNRTRGLRCLKRFDQGLYCLIGLVFASWFIIFYFISDPDWLSRNANLKTKPYHSSTTQPNNSVNETIQHDWLTSLGMIYNESDKQIKDRGYREHSFNVLLSERIGPRRTLPDTRNELCLKKQYDLNQLAALNTSVIICFYNEDFHTLKRTIYSVFENTPAQLLNEILVLNDFSDNDTPLRIKQHFEEVKLHNPDLYKKVRFEVTPERSGLIQARSYATYLARGQVYLFLDSHCEVNRQWLEPLLERILANSKTVVCPIIDLINPDSFVYSPSPIVKGGFNWGLHFKWDSVPHEMLLRKESFIQPIKSPTMAGGLFAIHRDFYTYLGDYDTQMDIWGGENIEMSFRTWMCGGQLEIIPCSRVGHVFRNRRPYGSPSGIDTLAYNSLRAAHVWMDDYKKYFLASRSDLANMDYGNVEKRLELRRKLNCSSFEWYLKNIYPEMLTPEQEKEEGDHRKNIRKINTGFNRKPQKVLRKIAIQLAGTRLCLESESEITYKGARLYLAKCSHKERRQHWKETEVHDVRLGPKSCLEAARHDSSLRLAKCHEMGGTQQWQLNKNKAENFFYNTGAGTCLQVKSKHILDESSDGKWLDSDLQLNMAYCIQSDALPSDEKKKKDDENWKIYNKWILNPS